LDSNWWALFKDPELNRLEAQVNLNNQSLAQAEAQFRQSQILSTRSASGILSTATARQRLIAFVRQVVKVLQYKA